MALDLIKKYLVGIGFSVDSNSLQDAENAIDNAGSTINNFSKNSSKGFSEAGSSLKDLFKLFGDTNGAIGKLFPNLQGPFKGIIKDITTIKNLYKTLNKNTSKSKADNKPTHNHSNNKKNSKIDLSKNESHKINLPSKTISDSLKIDESKDKINELKKSFSSTSDESQKSIGNIINALIGLKNKGSGAISGFSASAVSSFALIATATIAVIKSISKVLSYLNKLANQDIGYEKLSRQLWTTKENAKEIDMSLKTLGASMQDLWLSPTLLKQFNKLRQDSKDLKLPPEFNKNLKTVQDISFEFKRFKQLLSMFFQWIGNYIMKYCAGPLNEIKNGVKGFNNWLKKSIPGIAKILGTIIGVLLRIITIILKLASPVIYIFKLIGKLGDLFEKIPEPVQKAIKKIIASILLILSPILLVIALIDDLFTYFRGGKSVIGKYIDKIKDKVKNAGAIIKQIITVIKAILTGGLSLLPWDKYWEKAKETFEKIKDKAKETWDKVKEWSKSKLETAKDFISGTKDKVDNFVKGEDKSTVSQSYVTSNNSSISNNTTETKNSNNTVSNSNVINVYGGNDVKSTANAVNKNLTGITTRSLQGVY